MNSSNRSRYMYSFRTNKITKSTTFGWEIFFLVDITEKTECAMGIHCVCVREKKATDKKIEEG